MGSEPQSVFFTKSSTFLSSVSPCIVSMNNAFSPVVLWLELSQCCKDIITIVLGVKGAPLRKCHDHPPNAPGIELPKVLDSPLSAPPGPIRKAYHQGAYEIQLPLTDETAFFHLDRRRTEITEQFHKRSDISTVH
jgi:hypothetical protein